MIRYAGLDPTVYASSALKKKRKTRSCRTDRDVCDLQASPRGIVQCADAPPNAPPEEKTDASLRLQRWRTRLRLRVRHGQHTLRLSRRILPNLRQRVDDPTHEPHEDGAHAAERDGRVEEDQPGEGDGQLVEGADHGVGGGGGDAHGPGGGVGDEDGGEAREDHHEDDGVALVRGEVLGDVGGGPVFDEDGGDEEDGDGEEVVVVHCCHDY